MKLNFLFRVFNKLTKLTPFCSAVIVAGGSSQRTNGINKLFYEINDMPVIVHAIKAFQHSSCIREIVVVARKDTLQQVSDLCKEHDFSKVSKVIVGGSTRAESVLNGLSAISPEAELVAIHDAARPCIENSIIEKAVMKAKSHKAVAPAIRITSTLKKVQNDLILETVNRDDFVDIQTPQVFNVDLIKGALANVMKKELTVTDDCMAVELMGVNVYTVDGSVKNIKLTNVDDFAIAEALLLKYESLKSK